MSGVWEDLYVKNRIRFACAAYGKICMLRIG